MPTNACRLKVDSYHFPNRRAFSIRFYTKQHQFYCGIGLHARTMFVCILDQSSRICLEKNLHSNPDEFLSAIEPFRSDIVVCVECLFTWYWLADLCSEQGIPFVLGHALYMKAIHGGKAENDRIDAHKIAVLLRGGMIPQAYVYPPGMRSTRDVMRRRPYLVRERGQLLAHRLGRAAYFLMSRKRSFNMDKFLAA